MNAKQHFTTSAIRTCFHLRYAYHPLKTEILEYSVLLLYYTALCQCITKDKRLLAITFPFARIMRLTNEERRKKTFLNIILFNYTDKLIFHYALTNKWTLRPPSLPPHRHQHWLLDKTRQSLSSDNGKLFLRRVCVCMWIEIFFTLIWFICLLARHTVLSWLINTTKWMRKLRAQTKKDANSTEWRR